MLLGILFYGVVMTYEHRVGVMEMEPVKRPGTVYHYLVAGTTADPSGGSGSVGSVC